MDAAWGGSSRRTSFPWEIEIMKPDGRNVEVTVKGIFREDGESQESAPHPQQVLFIDLDGQAEPYDILRKRED